MLVGSLAARAVRCSSRSGPPHQRPQYQRERQTSPPQHGEVGGWQDGSHHQAAISTTALPSPPIAALDPLRPVRISGSDLRFGRSCATCSAPTKPVPSASIMPADLPGPTATWLKRFTGKGSSMPSSRGRCTTPSAFGSRALPGHLDREAAETAENGAAKAATRKRSPHPNPNRGGAVRPVLNHLIFNTPTQARVALAQNAGRHFSAKRPLGSGASLAIPAQCQVAEVRRCPHRFGWRVRFQFTLTGSPLRRLRERFAPDPDRPGSGFDTKPRDRHQFCSRNRPAGRSCRTCATSRRFRLYRISHT